MHKPLFYILAFFVSTLCVAQNSLSTEIYKWYDSNTITERYDLFKGIEYVEKDRVLNDEHKFFKTIEYTKGKLKYGGQVYNDVLMKYNIYDDLLLVNIKDELNNFFQLFSNEVAEFSLLGHTFKYIESKTDKNIKGFYEIMNDDETFEIYKKHILNRKRINDLDQIHFEFKEEDSEYIFELKGEYYTLDQSDDLITVFPEHENEINEFFKRNKKMLRKTPDVFMNRLADRINSILDSPLKSVTE